MEQAAYLGNGGEEAARARWRPRCRAVSRARVPAVWPRVWPWRPGSSWCRKVVGVRGGVGTADACEAVATTDVGRGGGAASLVWRAEWRGRRRGIGEERKEEDGTGIYMPRPFTPGAIPPLGVNVLYSRCVLPTGSKGTRFVTRTGSQGLPLLPVGNKHRE